MNSVYWGKLGDALVSMHYSINFIIHRKQLCLSKTYQRFYLPKIERIYNHIVKVTLLLIFIAESSLFHLILVKIKEGNWPRFTDVPLLSPPSQNSNLTPSQSTKIFPLSP